MMDNFDSNMIKPIDGLQNIAGIAPARRREDRRKKKNNGSQNDEQQNKPEEVEVVINQFDETLQLDDLDETKIDFRA